MKKPALFLFSAFLLSALATPAFADTDIYLNFSSGRPHHRPGPYRHHRPWHPGWRPAAPVFYAPPPVYVAPPPVVYRTTYVQPVVASSLEASPASAVYTDASGRLCREYQTTGWVGQAPRSLYGTACLQPDGSWRVVD